MLFLKDGQATVVCSWGVPETFAACLFSRASLPVSLVQCIW